MKTAVCVIIKDENSYIREFVEWYKSIGFDNVIIYDNNFSDGDKIEDVIGDYIESGYVIVENVKDKKIFQLPSYNSCVKKYGPNYDWVAFFDCDEHLHLVEDKTIQDFLSRFNDNVDSVVVNWMIMDDNDLVYNDGRPLEERFTRMSNVDYYTYPNVKENQHIKTILRCTDKNIKQAHFPNPHYVVGISNSVDTDGKNITIGRWYTNDINFNLAYLKHFQLKTIEEFLYNRYLKGASDVNFEYTIKHRNTVEKFFKVNKKTEEKENVIEKFFAENKDKIEQQRLRW